MVYDGMEKIKIFRRIIFLLTCILIILIGLFLIGNNYQMNEKRVNIPTTSGNLSAVITSPKQQKIKGIIVFVHGDGAQEATQNGGYKPLMERFAKQGYISVSWDKLGVGQSTGNWLMQTMDNRSQEVEEVIDWMEINYPDSVCKIGLWGASQAGWVIPKVMNENTDIKFSILVGPAINWMRQGEYNTGWLVKDSGGTKQEVIQAKQNFATDSQLIEENKSYDEYKKNGGLETMSPDRYIFIHKNINQDITNDLSKIQEKVYLVLAENDKNIDSSETEKIYTGEINKKHLEVKTIPKVEHQMINPQIAGSDFLINIVGLIFPKYLLIDDNYLDYCEQIVSNQ
jgi:alpha/beta superfamily hydrolase